MGGSDSLCRLVLLGHCAHCDGVGLQCLPFTAMPAGLYDVAQNGIDYHQQQHHAQTNSYKHQNRMTLCRRGGKRGDIYTSSREST